jgi:hypothetical protein
MDGLRWIVSMLTISLLAWGHGCSRHEPSSGSTSSAAPAAAASPGAVEIDLDPGGPTYADEDLAVAADFEAEAERDITPERYRDELEAIARELDASVPDASASSAVDAGAPVQGKPASGESKGPANAPRTDR